MDEVVGSREHFLILNGLVVTLVVLSFLLLRRGPKPPVKLDLNTPQAPPRKPLGSEDYRPRHRQVYGGRDGESSRPRSGGGGGLALGGAGALEGAASFGQEKSLNIFFNWNGHAWDAYEVLGVPAGASIEMVLKAFERAKSQADRETLPFLRAAYEAVVDTYTLR